MKQVGGSFIFGDLNQKLWRKMMLKHVDLFVKHFFRLMRPIRNPGYQLHLLRGDGNWKEENVEAFFHPSVGVLGADGKPKVNPISIYDPKMFGNNQMLGKYCLLQHYKKWLATLVNIWSMQQLMATDCHIQITYSLVFFSQTHRIGCRRHIGTS